MSDLVLAAGGQVRHTDTWLHVDNPRLSFPDHGWKLHISSRPADFSNLLQTVMPLLLSAECMFKVASSIRVLTELNDGVTSPASVGKAITVYPHQDQVTRLGAELVELLRGRVGPQVLSDRRVAQDAPVFYRYGPFRSTLMASKEGIVRSVMVGPDGSVFEGTATLGYEQPPWATDPFRVTSPKDDAGLPTLVGQHYRLDKGLMESARGNVYLATDVRTDEKVVLKQARAYVAEALDVDARIRLRNERFVLTALQDVAGVARFRDHFRHGIDEYLVTSYDGRFSLKDFVARKGRFTPLRETDPHATSKDHQSLDWLAHQLALTLQEIHSRGYLVRDLSPKNIVMGAAGDSVTYIDFGYCNHHNVVLRGGTKGYAPARQMAGDPAAPGDDLHALGMTLFVAMTGAEPVVDDDDPDASRVIALRMIERIFGDRPPPVVSLIAELLSSDLQVMTTAFSALADGRGGTDGWEARRHTSVPYRRGSEAAMLVDRYLTALLISVNEQLDQPEEISDASVYRGTAGVGLSLLRHLDSPGVAATVARIAATTSRTAERVALKPALYVGTTGAEIFLRRALAAGVPGEPLPSELLFGGPDERTEVDDVILGAAGIGLGHLLLRDLDPRPEHDAAIRHCLEFVTEHDMPRTFFDPEDASVPGLDTTFGLAHGHAGPVEFLRQLVLRSPTEDTRRLYAARLARLAEGVPGFIDRARRRNAVPLSSSWCRGMAGMGRVLLAAGRQHSDNSLVDLAVACADGCLRWLPYLTKVGQCCGLAGIGELFCDLVDHDERFLAAAESVTVQISITAVGTSLVEQRPHWNRTNDMSWSTGTAGILDFVTRLRDLGSSSITLGASPTVLGPF
ncbi:hypothetical protein Asi02nite_16000 [Asanoa siamensis]|uniref:Protein kinase domain-containing protein n=1 Tax=Asanoa siamensis TaxID=926357 RepID=A0ABQ4CML7_9ACTN|nr:hypothetical protein Asi02nite_16000 [Asanoa siamensis]